MLSCQQSPPGQLLLAIRQFNRQQWYDCHETLEELWLGETGEARDFLQGTLQLAVALHHWRNGNYGGAVSLLKSGAGYLKRAPQTCMWVDAENLAAAAERARGLLEELGEANMADLDQGFIPVIRTVSG